jgi:large subunit ribosomal protein L30
MADKKLKVTLTSSVAGQLENIRASVRGLGLRRIRDSRVVADTAEIRGMIRKAQHLLRVEQA